VSEFLRSNLRMTNPDGTPTRDFLDIFNRVVSQLGGQGRDRINEVATGVEATTPLINGVGLLTDVLATQESNINSAATASSNTSGLTVTASPSSIYKTGATGVALTSAGVTAAPSGGGTPYATAAWTRVSGSTNITAVSPSSEATTFLSGATGLPIVSARFCYDVEETGGDIAQTCVSVTFERTAGGELE